MMLEECKLAQACQHCPYAICESSTNWSALARDADQHTQPRPGWQIDCRDAAGARKTSLQVTLSSSVISHLSTSDRAPPRSVLDASRLITCRPETTPSSSERHVGQLKPSSMHMHNSLAPLALSVRVPFAAQQLPLLPEIASSTSSWLACHNPATVFKSAQASIDYDRPTTEYR